MKLFKSDASPRKIHIKENWFSTPLGNILLNACSEEFDTSKIPVTEAYCLSKGRYVLCWYTDSIDAELMITPYNPSLPENMKVDGCYAAVWRIRGKVKEISCRFTSSWTKEYRWTEVGPESGESLESQAWENPRIKVSLGTQDGEVLIARSKKNDLLPTSYDKSINPYSIVEYFDKGLIIPINNIRINQICQVHFVVAWAENIQYDTSTWYAVDALPSALLAAGEVW